MDENREYIVNYLEKGQRILDDFRQNQLHQIEKVISILFEAWKFDLPVFIMGNGGSASTASHLAADFAKTINDAPNGRGLRALTPWDNIPLISAIVNDRPKEDIFTSWLDTFYEGDGIGIGISVHGGSGSDFGGKWSQNLLKGLQFIKDAGGKTIGLSGFDGGPMKNLVDVCLVVPVEEKNLGTPLVESFHVVLHHLIVFRLKELINKQGEK
jgi:D-sedoheptulose 7-phosphate isomerase